MSEKVLELLTTLSFIVIFENNKNEMLMIYCLEIYTEVLIRSGKKQRNNKPSFRIVVSSGVIQRQIQWFNTVFNHFVIASVFLCHMYSLVCIKYALNYP